MNQNDKICCILSWNVFLRVIVGFLLLGIVFDIYKFEKITIFNLFSAVGAMIGFYLFYQRNKIFENQLIQKDLQYNRESHFKTFLEATKLLTDKNSTTEAKISAVYLLYDIAKHHPENIDRVIQILNKHLTPLIKCIENNCDKSSINKRVVYQKRINNSRKNVNIKKYEYVYKEIVNFDYNEIGSKKKIKEWRYKGNDTEKLISVVLDILKKTVLDIFIKNSDQKNTNIDLSNTVLFDIDTTTNKNDNSKNLKFKSIQSPTENLIFLNCKLNKVDFKNTILYYSLFINCDLSDSDFRDANLWGSNFINCNLKDVEFKNSECESVGFIDCDVLTTNQIKSMKFEFKEKIIKTKDKIISKLDKKEFQLNKEINILDENFYPIIIRNTNIDNNNFIFLSSKKDNDKFIELKIKLYKNIEKEKMNDESY